MLTSSPRDKAIRRALHSRGRPKRTASFFIDPVPEKCRLGHHKTVLGSPKTGSCVTGFRVLVPGQKSRSQPRPVAQNAGNHRGDQLHPKPPSRSPDRYHQQNPTGMVSAARKLATETSTKRNKFLKRGVSRNAGNTPTPEAVHILFLVRVRFL